jgi:hypothetical protein
MIVISSKFATAFVARAFGRVARVNALSVSTDAESVPSGERFNKIIELGMYIIKLDELMKFSE